LFNFSSKDGKLVLTEIRCWGRPAYACLETNLDCQCSAASYISCCSLGDDILVVFGEGGKGKAALVWLDDGPLAEGSVHVTELAVLGTAEWQKASYLCRVSSCRALLHFHCCEKMWTCDVQGTAIILVPLAVTPPVPCGFACVPIPLTGGGHIVAGSNICSDEIMIIYPGCTSFETVGCIPGSGRLGASLVLVKNRFVVGFGGWNVVCLDDLWIFDIQTHRTSAVQRQGSWHPADFLVSLVVYDEVLYLLGGSLCRVLHAISLLSLAELIGDGRMRGEFKEALHPHLSPNESEYE